MSSAPIGSGAEMPGQTSHASPPRAATSPTHCITCSRSPDHSPEPIIVACTAPKRMSAPIPVDNDTYAREKPKA